MNDYVTVLEMLYYDDCEILNAIENVSIALEILPIALELLFEECVSVCVRYLEAVPWSEEDEKRVISLIPLLKEDEKCELLGRVVSVKEDVSEEMLHGLISSAVQSHPNMAFAKAFVAKLLRDFSCRVSARRVLEDSFVTSLKVVKESLEEHLLWLIERMIELRVADMAVKEWSEQGAFTADLQRAFRDDAWRNIVPGLPAVVLRCTCRLANAVAAGVILVPRQVRMKLVKDWLPVLIVCKDNVTPMLTNHKPLNVSVSRQETWKTALIWSLHLPPGFAVQTDSYQLINNFFLERKPDVNDIQALYAAHNSVHRLPRMIGSIDCMHRKWFNCPKAWHGQFGRGDKKYLAIMLEAVASYNLWIWHAFFGVAGANNDLTGSNHSPLFDDHLDDIAPVVPYEVNGVTFEKVNSASLFGFFLGL
nr:hypothetical protein [Tanacetum cinerariifolium]